MAGRVSVDALAVPVALGEPLVGPAAEIDRQLGGLLSDAVSAEFRGRIDEGLPLPSAGVLGARRRRSRSAAPGVAVPPRPGPQPPGGGGGGLGRGLWGAAQPSARRADKR